MLRMVDRSNPKEGGIVELKGDGMGHLKKMKSMTHLMEGSTVWDFRKVMVALATFP